MRRSIHLLAWMDFVLLSGGGGGAAKNPIRLLIMTTTHMCGNDHGRASSK